MAQLDKYIHNSALCYSDFYGNVYANYDSHTHCHPYTKSDKDDHSNPHPHAYPDHYPYDNHHSNPYSHAYPNRYPHARTYLHCLTHRKP